MLNSKITSGCTGPDRISFGSSVRSSVVLDHVICKRTTGCAYNQCGTRLIATCWIEIRTANYRAVNPSTCVRVPCGFSLSERINLSVRIREPSVNLHLGDGYRREFRSVAYGPNLRNTYIPHGTRNHMCEKRWLVGVTGVCA